MKKESCQLLSVLGEKKSFRFLIQNTMRLNNFALGCIELNAMPFLCQN